MHRLLFITMLVLAAAAGALYIWPQYHNTADSSPGAAIKMDTADVDEEKKARDSHLAKRYLDGIPKGIVILDDADASAHEEIQLWEKKIVDYARSNQQKDLNPDDVRVLAIQTVSLFRLLKEASSRQDSGLEPYTPVSGFNTMTLVMRMEQSFKDTLDFTFSEFMSAQDGRLVKGLVKSRY